MITWKFDYWTEKNENLAALTGLDEEGNVYEATGVMADGEIEQVEDIETTTLKVSMKTTCDCMVAALAMLLNCTYEESAEYFPPKAIKETGYRWEWLVPYLSRNNINLSWFGKDMLKSVNWNKSAMVDVPSLTTDKGDHIVYWNGKQVVDPATGIRYNVLPKEILNVYQLKSVGN